jgi:hypothetical protein
MTRSRRRPVLVATLAILACAAGGVTALTSERGAAGGALPGATKSVQYTGKSTYWQRALAGAAVLGP